MATHELSILLSNKVDSVSCGAEDNSDLVLELYELVPVKDNVLDAVLRVRQPSNIVWHDSRRQLGDQQVRRVSLLLFSHYSIEKQRKRQVLAANGSVNIIQRSPQGQTTTSSDVYHWRWR